MWILVIAIYKFAWVNQDPISAKTDNWSGVPSFTFNKGHKQHEYLNYSRVTAAR